MKLLQRHQTVWTAQVQAKTKQSVVCGQRRDRCSVTLRGLDLSGDRVGLDIDAAPAGQMLLSQLLGPCHVQKSFCFAVQTHDLCLAKSITASSRVIPVKRPPAREAIRFQYGR